MMAGSVVWNDKALRLEVEKLGIAEIDKLALQIIAASDPPVDTGFLDASAYVNSSSGLNTFDEVWQTGEYVNRAGNLVERELRATPEPPPKNGAVAAWAAEYAAEVEERTSFIYQAVQEVAARNR